MVLVRNHIFIRIIRSGYFKQCSASEYEIKIVSFQSKHEYENLKTVNGKNK